MIIIGVDPDSDKLGVSLYRDGVLERLQRMTRIQLVAKYGHADRFSIENTLANNFLYSRNRNQNRNVEIKIAMSVGRCQQSQMELMRDLESIGTQYVLHKPQKGNWAEDEKTFKRITGWEGRSNKDTRSAAYFGYLEASRK